MVKVGLHTKLKPGAESEYEAAHAEVWPEVLAGMRAVGITNWTIFRDGLDLFHYIECEDYDAAIAQLSEDPVDQRWQQKMQPLTETSHDLSGEGRDRMRLIFEL
jgi:L-rhamnose mutarotase